jgi:hypothetical protein
MHSTFYFLLDLEDNDPRDGQGLLQACRNRWMEAYEEVMDENNWSTVIYCAERDGASVTDQGLTFDHEPPSYLDALRNSTMAVAYDLSMYGKSGINTGEVFLDINPFGAGNPGQDDSMLSELGDQALTELIAERGAAYLAASYAELAKNPNRELIFHEYRRGAFAKRFELFMMSSRRPFSADFPTPYEYPAIDLRHQPFTGREAILAVDIHT